MNGKVKLFCVFIFGIFSRKMIYFNFEEGV
jgi:hypothetical protein